MKPYEIKSHYAVKRAFEVASVGDLGVLLAMIQILQVACFVWIMVIGAEILERMTKCYKR